VHLFYAPKAEVENFLSKEESLHCCKVMRAETGTEIKLTNGKGQIFTAKIEDANPKKTTFQITNIEKLPLQKPAFHLFIAPTKNINRLEWLLEKSTEIGIDSITPILTNKSERKVVRIDRLERIAIAAMKQSYRAVLPIINEITTFKNAIEKATLNKAENFIAYYHTDNKNLSELIRTGKAVNMFIGPEGDFSEDEKKTANNYKFTSVNLANYRLRTETAGLIANQIFRTINEINTIE